MNLGWRINLQTDQEQRGSGSVSLVAKTATLWAVFITVILMLL